MFCYTCKHGPFKSIKLFRFDFARIKVFASINLSHVSSIHMFTCMTISSFNDTMYTSHNHIIFMVFSISQIFAIHRNFLCLDRIWNHQKNP